MIRPSPVDHAFRTEWPSLVATLVRETGSLELAEDAVSDAFVEASTRWRTGPPPRNPGAWLLTTARRKAIDRIRRTKRFEDRIPALVQAQDQLSVPNVLSDDQLALIAGCVHPALNDEAQVALTLRYVCGLSTEQIARAFLVPVETMKKRLTRAKHKIEAAGVPFVVPEANALHERIVAICGVVYAVFNEGYASTVGEELIRGSLCDEAIWLSELLCELVPNDAEVHGLAGLILLTDARRHARSDNDGLPVLLEDQDRAEWDGDKIRNGKQHLERARVLNDVGPYQLMGWIAAIHASAHSVECTPWGRIAGLYGALISMHDTPILRLNQAAALAWSEGPAIGLALIDELESELRSYSYFHSARAALFVKLGRVEEALAAYRQAIEHSNNEAELRWMHARCEQLEG